MSGRPAGTTAADGGPAQADRTSGLAGELASAAARASVVVPLYSFLNVVPAIHTSVGAPWSSRELPLSLTIPPERPPVRPPVRPFARPSARSPAARQPVCHVCLPPFAILPDLLLPPIDLAICAAASGSGALAARPAERRGTRGTHFDCLLNGHRRRRRRRRCFDST